MASANDFLEGLLFSEEEPTWLSGAATSTTQAVLPEQAFASQHPLLKPSASEEATEDVFDSLDAFLASEFPELESECISQSVTESGSLRCNTSSAAVQPAVPALSSSSCDSQTIGALPAATAATATGPFTPTGSAPTAAESAAAAAAAAAKAQAQAFAMPGPFTSPLSSVSSGSVDIGRSNSISSTATIPRWKLFHMQQRQELLAPKAQGPKLACVIPAAPAAAVACTGCTSPVSVVSGTCISPAAAAGLSSITSIALPQAISTEQLLLLNLHQQQQCAAVVGSKRPSWVEPLGPSKKRSRVTAAGNTAAQHMYGLAVEPSQQLQTLQVLQLQLQQQIQQNYQQQAELYQQQQLQALHQQLHLRLAVQQQQYQFTAAPTTVRHKRQGSRPAKN